MKKSVKICVLSILVLLLTSAALMGLGAVVGGDFGKALGRNGFYPGIPFGRSWKYWHTEPATAQNDKPNRGDKFYLPDGVENATALEITVEAEDVKLNKGEAFSVENHGLANDQITSYMDGTTWHIELTGRRYTRGSLHITVPETKVFDTVKLYSDVGKIAGSGADAVDFEAQTNTGTIELSDVNAQTMKLDAEIGTIEIFGTVQNTSTLSAKIGTVQLNVPKPEQYGYDISCALGEVTLFDNTVTGMEVNHQFNTKQAAQAQQVPLFSLDCEMGKVQVLEK